MVGIFYFGEAPRHGGCSNIVRFVASSLSPDVFLNRMYHTRYVVVQYAWTTLFRLNPRWRQVGQVCYLPTSHAFILHSVYRSEGRTLHAAQKRW